MQNTTQRSSTSHDITGYSGYLLPFSYEFSALPKLANRQLRNRIFDAAGSVVDKTTSSTVYDRWKFDASGKNVEMVMRWFQTTPSPGIDRTETVTNTFDGDGLGTKRVDSKVAVFNGTTTTTDTTEYYVNSSVLGGRRITEIDGAGAKKQTNVVLNNGVLAEQAVTSTTSEVYWRHDDPVSASYTKIDRSGNEGTAIDPPSKVEFEPNGGAIPIADPNSDPTLALPSSARSAKYSADVHRPEYTCVIDGIMQADSKACSDAFSRHIIDLEKSHWGYWVDEDGQNKTKVGPNGEKIPNIDTVSRFVPFPTPWIPQAMRVRRDIWTTLAA